MDSKERARGTHTYRHTHARTHTHAQEQNVPGLTGVDTRALTKEIREHGAMPGHLGFGVADSTSSDLVPTMGKNWIAEVSRKGTCVCVSLCLSVDTSLFFLRLIPPFLTLTLNLCLCVCVRVRACVSVWLDPSPSPLMFLSFTIWAMGTCARLSPSSLPPLLVPLARSVPPLHVFRHAPTQPNKHTNTHTHKHTQTHNHTHTHTHTRTYAHPHHTYACIQTLLCSTPAVTSKCLLWTAASRTTSSVSCASAVPRCVCVFFLSPSPSLLLPGTHSL